MYVIIFVMQVGVLYENIILLAADLIYICVGGCCSPDDAVTGDFCQKYVMISYLIFFSYINSII